MGDLWYCLIGISLNHRSIKAEKSFALNHFIWFDFNDANIWVYYPIFFYSNNKISLSSIHNSFLIHNKIFNKNN